MSLLFLFPIGKHCVLTILREAPVAKGRHKITPSELKFKPRCYSSDIQQLMRTLNTQQLQRFVTVTYKNLQLPSVYPALSPGLAGPEAPFCQ